MNFLFGRQKFNDVTMILRQKLNMDYINTEKPYISISLTS